METTFCAFDRGIRLDKICLMSTVNKCICITVTKPLIRYYSLSCRSVLGREEM